MMQLLSIDFDYFFPESQSDPQALYDWGHRESKLFIEDLWEIRASGFLANKMDLPGLSGEEQTFWKRIKVINDAPLYLAESHAYACDEQIIRRFMDDERRGYTNAIWSFDAHHDLGYHDGTVSDLLKGKIDCGTWLLYYFLRWDATIHVRYPRWKRNACQSDGLLDTPSSLHTIDRSFCRVREKLPVFDAIFLCRSGAWVPSWLDTAFHAFAQAAPTQHIIFIDGQYPLNVRLFNHDVAQNFALETQRFREQSALYQSLASD
jgi:hypothetical protein